LPRRAGVLPLGTLGMLPTRVSQMKPWDYTLADFYVPAGSGKKSIIPNEGF
jgi:hypothetical protein